MRPSKCKILLTGEEIVDYVPILLEYVSRK